MHEVLQPAQYNVLLGLTNNITGIEDRIRVDAESDIQNNRVLRAGFFVSGVSFNNRVIERHQGQYGAYWKSYDFATDDYLQDIFRNPLGPVINGQTSKAFVHNGGEMIFTLPNGLHGYYLSNNLGDKLDLGPTNIVTDPTRADKIVTNGISCFTCHTAGWIPKKDEIREYAATNRSQFSNTQFTKINTLYPVEATMTEAFTKDVSAYVETVKKLGINVSIAEPVSTNTLYYDADMTVATMAVELEVTTDQLDTIIRNSPELRRQLDLRSIEGALKASRINFERNFSTVLNIVRAALR